MEDKQARMRFDQVESRMSVLEESVNRAVGTLLPKVDALLSGRSGREQREPISHSSISTPAPPPSSLLEMAKRGDYEAILRLLVNLEIDIQRNPECTANGDTALHVSANEGHVKTVVVLLGMGAKVNASGYRLRTPLHCAAAQGHLAVAQRLLFAGAKVDAENADGATPLSVAAGEGRRDMVILLLQKGAQPNETVFSMAAENGHWDLVELFLQNGRWYVDVCTKDGDPLIVLAAKDNSWEMVQLLLEKGASATKCKTDKECALVWASQAGQADAVRELLQRGALSNVDQVLWALSKAKSAAAVWAFVDMVPDKIRGSFGEYSLREAGIHGRLEAMVAFLEAGVNINAIDSNHSTALCYAAANGHLACVKALLQRGADDKAKDVDGNTPLHVAALKDHLECVRALLDAGANPTERNNEGKTPLEVAGSDGVRELLKQTHTSVGGWRAWFAQQGNSANPGGEKS